MDIQAVKPAVTHAGRRLGLYLLICGIIGVGALAWATDGFRKPLTWTELQAWRNGDLVLDLPDIKQHYENTGAARHRAANLGGTVARRETVTFLREHLAKPSPEA